MLRARGRRVEVQNYIDNTGVQVADVVVGFHHLEHKTPQDVRGLIEDPAVRFDYYCWDLYARTSAYYKENADALAWRAAALHSIEAGEGVQAELAHLVADAIVRAHLATMLRLGVEYDVLPRESEILHLKFWASAFELLKQRQAIYLETEGKNAGCWVMPGASFRDDAEAEDSKVIVRSNGTVTYVGKDIAYQLWKFGLLGRISTTARSPTYADGRVLWVSSDQPGDVPDAPRFGHGTRVYNVIDARQSYLAGRGGGGAAGAGLHGTGRPVRALQLRNGGALAALLRGAGHFALRGGPQAALRGSLRAQGPGREGGRPARYPDCQSARRGGCAPPRSAG